MRIVYDYQIFSAQAYGGISRYFIELARRISAWRVDEVKILAPLYINNYVHDLDAKIVTGLHVPVVPRTSRLRISFNRIASRYWLTQHVPDILHETYYSTMPLVTAQRAKTVITVHDMIHERFPEFCPDGGAAALIKRQTVERADHVICISETTRKDLLDITAVNPDKVSVVYHGFGLTNSEAHYEKSIIEEPYILFVGSRSYHKNFERLLKAYSSNQVLYKRWKLICFGGGQFTSAEQRLKKQLGLAEDRLLWFGGADRDLEGLYRHAAALVYPSLYEGFGIPPLEAMSFGCPVICSHGGSIPEMVGDAGEFFDPYDESDISQAIERVVAVPGRAEILRALGKKRVTHFSWDTCVNETYKIYKSLA
jgi:glycosyltransferase involved in cell wall biosynthesis